MMISLLGGGAKQRQPGDMERIAVIGNAGGGKSTLARALATRRGLPYVEIDSLLWCDGWQLAPENEYEAAHARLIAEPRWVIDGLGRMESLAARLARAGEIVLVDLPLWMHFWLAAERQIAWARGEIAHPPAGAREMPPTEDLFRTIYEVDRDWMPELRRLVATAEASGARVERITDLEALNGAASRSAQKQDRRALGPAICVCAVACQPCPPAVRRQLSIREYSNQVRSRYGAVSK